MPRKTTWRSFWVSLAEHRALHGHADIGRAGDAVAVGDRIGEGGLAGETRLRREHDIAVLIERHRAARTGRDRLDDEVAAQRIDVVSEEGRGVDRHGRVMGGREAVVVDALGLAGHDADRLVPEAHRAVADARREVAVDEVELHRMVRIDLARLHDAAGLGAAQRGDLGGGHHLVGEEDAVEIARRRLGRRLADPGTAIVRKDQEALLGVDGVADRGVGFDIRGGLLRADERAVDVFAHRDRAAAVVVNGHRRRGSSRHS